MNVLCIDVGLKNLSLCLINNIEIKLWENYNVFNENTETCVGLKKNGNNCNKKASMFINNTFFCKTHCINKNKQYQIKKIKIKDYLLQDLAKHLIIKLNEIFNNNKELFETLTEIYIELQPKLNPKMKLFSHLIFGKIIELFLDKKIKIRFLSAGKKLYCLPKDKKNTYKKRKEIGIELTLKLLQQFNDNEIWNKMFISNKKRDDLADAFLMCCYVNKFISLT